MLDDKNVIRTIDCEPRPGFLVRTVCSYYGILKEMQGDGRWVVFLANGLCVIIPQEEFWILPLSCDAESPASFHEILRVVGVPEMPSPKKPIQVNQKLLARTGEFDDTQLPYILLDAMIAQFHPDLAEANIAVGYSYGWKANRDAKIILASVSLFSDFDRQMHNKDIKILLNYNYWHNPITTDDNRRALMDHQLCHPRPVMDLDLGIPVRNEMGMIKYYLRAHDIEDFTEVVERWGIWQVEMERSAEVLAAAWEKEKIAREVKTNEELEEEEPDGEMSDGSTHDPREVLTLSK